MKPPNNKTTNFPTSKKSGDIFPKKYCTWSWFVHLHIYLCRVEERIDN